MARVKDLVVNIGASTKGLNKELGKARTAFSRTFGNIQKMGSSLTKSVTLPLAAIGGSAVKVFADFEQGMAQVKAISGATDKQFKALTADAKRLGMATRFTATEVSGLQLEYSKLGFTTEETLNATEATLNLAQATGTDLARAAEVAGATLRAYGLDAKETGHLTDVMAKSFSSSALDMEAFGTSMSFVAPVAKAAGVSVEETSAMLAVLANAGIKGSKAGTALRRIFSELSNDGTPLTEQFKRLGQEGLNLADAKDEVGRSAQSALLILSEGAEKIQPLTQELKNADGAARAMAKTMDDTTTGQIKLMQSAIEGAQLVIGEALAPAITDLAKKIAELANWFSHLDKDTQKTIISFAGFAALMGPAIIAIGSITKNVMLLGRALMFMIPPAGAVTAELTMMRTALLGPIGAALAFAGAGFASLYNKIKRAKEETERYNNLTRESAKALKAAAKASREYHESVDQTATIEEKLADLTLPKLKSALGRVEGEVKILSETMGHSIGQDDLDRIKELEEGYKGVELFGLTPLEAALADYRKELKASQEPQDNFVEGLTDTEKAAAAAAAALAKVQGILKASEKTGEELGLAPDQLNVGGLLGSLGKGASSDTSTGSVGGLLGMLGGMDMEPVKAVLTDLEMAAREKAQRISEAMAQIGATIGAQFGNLIGKSKEIKQALAEGIITPMEAMEQKAAAAKDALKGFAIDAIRSVIGMAKANVIANATSPANPTNLFSGGLASPALIVAGLSMLEGFLGSIPSLAVGGLASSPVMAMVGDHSNRSANNPEVIAPLDKLKGMIGGGNMSASISGRDILLTSSRDKNRSRRTYGSLSI